MRIWRPYGDGPIRDQRQELLFIRVSSSYGSKAYFPVLPKTVFLAGAETPKTSCPTWPDWSGAELPSWSRASPTWGLPPPPASQPEGTSASTARESPPPPCLPQGCLLAALFHNWTVTILSSLRPRWITVELFVLNNVSLLHHTSKWHWLGTSGHQLTPGSGFWKFLLIGFCSGKLWFYLPLRLSSFGDSSVPRDFAALTDLRVSDFSVQLFTC